MGDYALYQAIKSFKPTSEEDLEFQKGDVFQISIESPYDGSQTRRPGWLFAYSRKTRAVGYVPVECVKLLGSEIGKTIHHPSACGVEVSNNKLETENKPLEHRLDDVYFCTPILCKHCKDYISGQGHIGVKCKDNDKMNVNDIETLESADSEQAKIKMYRRLTTAADSKFASLLPFVNIDAENYMLRGIGRPVLPSSEAGATSNGNMEHQVSGSGSGTALTTSASACKKKCETDIFWGWGTDVAGGDGVDCCARILSFHSILCSCEMSCCCKCVTLCSIDCHACFHNYCLRFFPKYLCQKDNDVLPPATLDYDKPITEWTSSNVVEWMAALNLYPYSDVFRCKDIKGADLINLDRDKLIGMGIKDEYHQKAILTCIDELLKKPEDTPISNEPEECPPLSTIYAHNLTQHSFSTLERCDKCNKYLRGILHQGFICQDCGLVAHRTCAATGLPSCTHRPMDENSHFIQFKSYFGQGLCVQFKLNDTPAPQLLMNCTFELEKRAKSNESLELYNLYCATPPSDQLQALVRKVEENPNSVDLTDFSPVCIAGLFKKYLRELPDPLIPVQWYDKFLEAAKKEKR
ncbi:hypothetical protein NQ317_018712 [Molorchus minor]|uniref:Uncharacterized protein n=1 Tax=Molorchus minor TaxID=1323400 RepID=A0ABQ9JTI7_9CUCU|nr:hypothetical protein NQ317_018712 [Molorchus minor]